MTARMSRFVLGSVLMVCLAGAGAAWADYTFPAFSLVADDDGTPQALNTALVPAGTYGSYTVSASWSGAVGSVAAVSDEAEWTLAVPGDAFLTAFSGKSPDAKRDYSPHTLNWSGMLLQSYSAGDPLVFTARQNLFGTVANWTNVSITLHTGTVPPATPPAAFPGSTISPGTQRAYAWLESGDVIWIRFTLPAVQAASCQTLRFETAASELETALLCSNTCATASNGACEDGGATSEAETCALGTDCTDCGPRNTAYRSGNDSELALFTADGFLIATNDDVDQLGPHLGGALAFGANEGSPVAATGDLSAGMYYLALAGYDTDFGLNAFDVVTTTGVSGVIALDVSYNAPALDCNSNGIPDVCDIAGGGSADADTNGIPDECPENDGPPPLCSNPAGTPDLDGDGLRDFCDTDRDNDGIPNELDACPHAPVGGPAQANGAPVFDADFSCAVGASDYAAFAGCLANSGPGKINPTSSCQQRHDADHDGDNDLFDFAALQRLYYKDPQAP